MDIRKSLSRRPWLRRTTLGLLRFLERDITVRNPWTGDKLKLNLYRHKGYWYYGAKREPETMGQWRQLIRRGDVFIEVGGHIGFITQYFSKLVGPEGRVVVFEPGVNNLRYTEVNLRPLKNVTLERAAVSSCNGTAVLYEDGISGQNNSLDPNYYRLNPVAASHGVRAERIPHEVPTVTLDSYVASHGIKPDFLKIDVEGFELEVLRGATQTLRTVRGLVVEISENEEEVTVLLRDAGFALRPADGNTICVRGQESVAVG